MLWFFFCVLVLILGYAIYGRIIEKIFVINPKRQTPAYQVNDGVDYMPMSKTKIWLRVIGQPRLGVHGVGDGEEDRLALGGGGDGDRGVHETEYAGLRQDVVLIGRLGECRLHRCARTPDGGGADGEGDDNQSEDGCDHAHDASNHDVVSLLLADMSRTGVSRAPGRAREPSRGAQRDRDPHTTRRPGLQNRMPVRPVHGSRGRSQRPAP